MIRKPHERGNPRPVDGSNDITPVRPAKSSQCKATQCTCWLAGWLAHLLVIMGWPSGGLCCCCCCCSPMRAEIAGAQSQPVRPLPACHGLPNWPVHLGLLQCLVFGHQQQHQQLRHCCAVRALQGVPSPCHVLSCPALHVSVLRSTTTAQSGSCSQGHAQCFPCAMCLPAVMSRSVLRKIWKVAVVS